MISAWLCFWLFCSFVLFCSAEVWTQVSRHARQDLYHWGTPSAHIVDFQQKILNAMRLRRPQAVLKPLTTDALQPWTFPVPLISFCRSTSRLVHSTALQLQGVTCRMWPVVTSLIPSTFLSSSILMVFRDDRTSTEGRWNWQILKGSMWQC